MARYNDPFIAKLITVFNAEGPAFLKNRYYYGDPIIVEKSGLPAVFITKDKTTINVASNAEDETNAVVTINVVLDLTRDWGQAFNNINSSNQVYDAIEGRNADYTLKSTSLAYLLRKHMDLDTKTWISLRDALELDYGVTIGKRGDGIYTVEGVMRFTITQQQLRPGLGG